MCVLRIITAAMNCSRRCSGYSSTYSSMYTCTMVPTADGSGGGLALLLPRSITPLNNIHGCRNVLSNCPVASSPACSVFVWGCRARACVRACARGSVRAGTRFRSCVPFVGQVDRAPQPSPTARSLAHAECVRSARERVQKLTTRNATTTNNNNKHKNNNHRHNSGEGLLFANMV